MEVPAVTDPTPSGLDTDRLRFSLSVDRPDCVDDIAMTEEKAPEKVEEDATSLGAVKSDFADKTIQKEERTSEESVIEKDIKIQEDAIDLMVNGSDRRDGIAQKEEKALKKTEEDANSLTAMKSDFADETIEKEERIPEKSVFEEDIKIKEDAVGSSAGSDCADDIVQKVEKSPEKIEEDATSTRAGLFAFANEPSHKEDTGETIQKEEKTPEKSIVDDLKIQEDATSMRAEGSDCADDTANEEQTAPKNVPELPTSFGAEGSDLADHPEIYRKAAQTDDNAKNQEKALEKSTVEKDETIEDNAEGSGFADDTAKEEEKSPRDILEGSTNLGAEIIDFADETAHKEETDVDAKKEEKVPQKSIVEEDEKIQDGATSLRADDADCADDTAQAEEKSPVKSTTEQIQEDAVRFGVQNTGSADGTSRKETDESAKKEEEIPGKSIVEKDEKILGDATSLRADDCDSVDATAQEEVKTPVKSATERLQEDDTNLRVQNSGFADEAAHNVPNSHGMVKKPGKNENTQKESSQAKGDPDNQPASRLASTSERTANPPPSTTPSTVRPAGLGRAAPLLEHAPRAVQQPRVNGTTSQMQTQQIEDPNGEVEEYDETREHLQMIRVKFLRLAHRLGQTPHNVVVAQVLYRLGLAEQLRGRNGGRVGAFSFDRASAMAEQLEAAGQEPLDFSCTIMVLGKTGVGKSATINSIFDEQKFCTDAFQMGTQKVQDVVGTVQGIKVRVIDTPGLLSSWSDQRQNVKILHSVKQFIKKTPPDIVLYLDRLDMQSRDFGDMPLLRTITEIFGPSIWFNAIVVLTHAASAPPDGPNGTASSYDMFVTQRSHVVQQSIRQAAGDMRLMNPVSLVENHSACRTNRAGQRVLPNGQVWKPHLLLLSFASKILAEANTLLKLQDSPPGKPSTTRSRAPPLPFLLSSLLQSKPQLKLPGEQVGGDDDDDLDSSSDSDNETEYDDLPPFTRLTKAQVAMLTKSQKKAYFDELSYREKLYMKKQLKEEKRQRKMMKKMAASEQGLPSVNSESVEEESDTVIPPALMPDLALPASFDSSNPTHRYRCLDSVSQWVVRPVLDTHGWDHDVGYEGINVERFFVVKNKLPVAFSGQASKDKKDANIQMEVNSSLSHGEGKSTSMGFDLQTVGKDMAYTLRGETKFCNHRRNKATAGVSATVLGDVLSTGVKVEDKLIINKCFRMVMAGGAMSGRGDVAYGGSLEAQWRDKDYPIGRFLSTLGLSIMDWHGDLAIGGNIQSQIPIGRSTNLIARANLNNRGTGQINIRFNSSEQLQIALFGLIPLLRKVVEQLSQSQYVQQ